MGKIGRNEKCHCGSDKKYKQCCLENDNFKKYYKRNAEEFIFGGFGVQNERLKPVDSNNGSSFNFYDSKIIIKQDLNIPNLEDLLKNIFSNYNSFKKHLFCCSQKEQLDLHNLIKNQKLLKNDKQSGIGSLMTNFLFKNTNIIFNNLEVNINNVTDEEKFYANCFVIVTKSDKDIEINVIKNEYHEYHKNFKNIECLKDGIVKVSDTSYFPVTMIRNIFDNTICSIDTDGGNHTQIHRFCKMTRENNESGIMPFIVEENKNEDDVIVYLVTICFATLKKAKVV